MIVSLIVGIVLLCALFDFMVPGFRGYATAAVRSIKHHWTALSAEHKKALIAGAIALALCVFMSGLVPIRLGLSAWEHWQVLLVLGVLLLVLLEIYKKPLGDSRKPLRNLLMGTYALLFVVMPIRTKLEEPRRTICDPAGWQTRSCLVTAAGTEFFSADSDILSGPSICYDPYAVVGSERVVRNGRSFFRFFPRNPGPNDRIVVRYRVVNGPCPSRL